MALSANIQIGGNVEGNIVVGDNNFVVNTNHGTIVYKQADGQDCFVKAGCQLHSRTCHA